MAKEGYYGEIVESARFLRERLQSSPKIGIVLGTGMHALTKTPDFSVQKRIVYADIPHFAPPTAESHQGMLLAGVMCGKNVMVMQGRLHYYEGYSMQVITHPIRVMKALGVEMVLICNAAGGINPKFSLGDVMLITDHINLLPDNPLRGANINELGPRFPDMFKTYSPRLLEIARSGGHRLQEGVYVAVAGPNLETPAEYRYLSTIGADAVGMSTVPEVIVATHMGMECCALSIITDLCYPSALQAVDIAQIMKVAKKGDVTLMRILLSIVEKS